MPGSRRSRVIVFPILFGLAGLAAATPLSACTQDVCAMRQSSPAAEPTAQGDVVGCGGRLDEIYRHIEYPASPG